MAAPSFGEMAVFAAAIREGGFSAAARALGITKQSVSERVAHLEQRLGVQLIVRSPRGVRLTEVGEQYYEACEQIVARAEEADRVARQAQHRVTGTLRITSPVGLNAALVMPVVREYLRVHPGVSFEVMLEERVIDVMREHFDVAIRAGGVEPSASLFGRALFNVELVHVASSDYIAKHGEPRDLPDLEKAPCVTRRLGEDWSLAGQSVRVRSQVSVNTYEGNVEAALAGLGVARVPRVLVDDHVRAGTLRVVLEPARRVAFTAIWPSRRLPAKTRTLVDLLLRRARELESA